MPNDNDPFAPGGPDGPPVQKSTLPEKIGAVVATAFALTIGALLFVAAWWALTWLIVNMPGSR